MKVIQLRKKILVVFILASFSTIFMFFENMKAPDDPSTNSVRRSTPLSLINRIIKKVMTREKAYSENLAYMDMLSLDHIVRFNQGQNIPIKYKYEIELFSDMTKKGQLALNDKFEKYLTRKTLLDESDEHIIRMDVGI
jgi:hypothetical protein